MFDKTHKRYKWIKQFVVEGDANIVPKVKWEITVNLRKIRNKWRGTDVGFGLYEYLFDRLIFLPKGGRLFLGIGLFLVGSTYQIVYTYIMEISQLAGQFQRQGTLFPLVF